MVTASILFAASAAADLLLRKASLDPSQTILYMQIRDTVEVCLALAPLFLGICFSAVDRRRTWLHAGLLLSVCEVLLLGILSLLFSGSVYTYCSPVLFSWGFWSLMAAIYIGGILTVRTRTRQNKMVNRTETERLRKTDRSYVAGRDNDEKSRWKMTMAALLGLIAVLFVISMFVMDHTMQVRIEMQGEVSEEMLAIVAKNRSISAFCSQSQMYLVLGTLLVGAFFGLAHQSIGALTITLLTGLGEIVLLTLFSFWKMGSPYTYTEHFQFTHWFQVLFIGIYLVALLFILWMRRKEQVETRI